MPMPHELDLLDAVVLTKDVPKHELRRGHVGTIVEVLAPNTYEVKFSDDEGTPFAIVPLQAEHLLRLRMSPHAAS